MECRDVVVGHDQVDLRAATHEVLELGDHLRTGRLVQLDSDVVGRSHDVLGHRRLLADRVEHRERAPAVATPQAVGQRFDLGLRSQTVELHQPGLTEELLLRRIGGLAVPVVQVRLERDAELLDLGRHLFADVEAVGELAAEDRHDALTVVGFDGVLPRQLGPVDVGLVAAVGLDHERSHAACVSR